MKHGGGCVDVHEQLNAIHMGLRWNHAATFSFNFYSRQERDLTYHIHIMLSTCQATVATGSAFIHPHNHSHEKRIHKLNMQISRKAQNKITGEKPFVISQLSSYKELKKKMFAWICFWLGEDYMENLWLNMANAI